MRYSYLDIPKKYNTDTSTQRMMDDAFCFSMQHRNMTQQSNKLKYTLVSDANENQNKRVLFYNLFDRGVY